MIIGIAGTAFAQQEPADEGTTPQGMAPGAPAGSYPLSDIDVINLFSGSLGLRLPLLKIGGRGDTSHDVILSIQQRWGVKKNNEPLPKYWPRFNYWRGRKPGYGPGTLAAYQEFDPDLNEALTRFTFNAADGTQYEFRDALTEGQQLGPGGNGCRGQIFQTSDGSAATYVADIEVCDRVPPLTAYNYGRLLFADGREYRIDNGLVSHIRDRNGNVIRFTHADPPSFHPPGNGPQVTQITDSLNRVVTFSYATTSAPHDIITFKGFGGANRTIQVDYSNLADALIEGETVKTLPQLFPELNWADNVGSYDPKVVSSVTLPDNREYSFNYNAFGELSEIILPTGGIFRYAYSKGHPDAYQSGVMPDSLAIYRRVTEKSVYGADGFHAMRTTFTGELATGTTDSYVDVDHLFPSGGRISLSRHSFRRRASWDLTALPFQYPIWNGGKEYQTETWSDLTGWVRTVDHLWEQRAPHPWAGGTDPPPMDPRIVETKTTLETGQVSKTTFAYDTYNNRTDVQEYDFGAGAPGPLLRRRLISYLTTHPVNGTNYATNLNVHLRRLPVLEDTLNADGTLKARTFFDYDVYTTTPPLDSLPTTPTGRLSPEGHGTGYITRGNLTALRRWLNTTGGELVTKRRYDMVGNVVVETDPRDYSTTFTYSDRFGQPDGEARSGTVPDGLGSQRTFAFASIVTNAAGHQTYTQRDYYLGRPVDQEDANAAVASMFYNDALDRPTEVIVANNTALRARTTFSYDDVGRTVTTRRDRDAFNDQILRTEVRYDGLGREVESRLYESGTSYISTSTLYDAKGRVASVANPDRNGGPGPSWTDYTYDALDRVSVVEAPAGAQVVTEYSGNLTTVTDPAGKKRRSKSDAAGRVVEVVEDPLGLNYATSYEYDALDSLAKATQGTQVRTFGYDSVSRLKTASNPEQTASATYDYDSNGNLLSRTDARGITTTSTYDALNRLTTRSYSDGTPGTTYTYDDPLIAFSKGRLTRVSSSASATHFDEYDARGRVKGGRQVTDGVMYSMSYGYDRAGNLTSQTYPSGRLVNTAYDAAGRIGSVTEGTLAYAGQFTYTDHGVPATFRLGNGLWEQTVFNSRLQPERIALGESPTTSEGLNLEYGYGFSGSTNNGNVMSQTITAASLLLTQNYTYDALNRLKTAAEVGNWSQTYDYDRWGNRAVTAGHVLAPALTPQALDVYNTATNRFKTTSGYGYDNAGNLTLDASGRTFAYDAENRQKQAGTTTYIYDGDGRRVKKLVGTAASIYVHDAFGKLVSEQTAASHAGVSYVTPDHLGSTRVVTNGVGVVQGRLDYLPFGEEIPASWGTRGTLGGYGSDGAVRQKFTGKERDLENGLDFFQARYYVAPQGRFQSPDPILFQAAALLDPQVLNLYGYVRNSPLLLLDSRGEAIELLGDAELKRKALDALRQAVGPQAARYLYENHVTDANGRTRSFVGIYANGPTGKGASFDALNQAAESIGNIIALNEVVGLGVVPRGTTLTNDAGRTISLGRIQDRRSPGATLRQAGQFNSFIIEGPVGSVPSHLMSNGQAGEMNAGILALHELGHAAFEATRSWWDALFVEARSNRSALELENQARRVKNPDAPTRVEHD